MSDERLALARSNGVLPDLSGPVLVIGPAGPARVSCFSDLGVTLVQSSHRLTQLAAAAGLAVGRDIPENAGAAVVALPRAKAEARHLIGQAAAHLSTGWIIVDGHKTDGIDSILKMIGKSGVPVQSYSKAHGKVIWFAAQDAKHLAEWRGAPQQIGGDWWTAPGVFSADSVDPASEFLIEHLPPLSGVGADLGAGWGYLSAEVLQRNKTVTRLHLVEDNATALECAQRNVPAERAVFHWHDALNWSAPEKLDWIVMNPPFHDGRAADPELGRAFIRKAAQLLSPGGRLFMVANAHLPYDDELNAQFHTSEIHVRTSRFKLFTAEAKRTVTRRR